MALFNNTDQLRLIIPQIHRAAPFADLLPALDQAMETYIVPLIGQTLADQVQANFPGNGDADLTALSAILKKAQAFYAYYDLLTANSISLSPMGVTQAQSNDGLASPADGWLRNDSRKQAADKADAYMEKALQYLETAVLANSSKFTAWQQSQAYKDIFELMIWDSAQLARYIPQVRNGRKFLYMLRSSMLMAQSKSLAPSLGTYYDTLLTAIRNRPTTPLTVNQEKLLSYIRPWLAFQSVLNAIPFHRVEMFDGGIRFPTYDGPNAAHSKRDAGDNPIRSLSKSLEEMAEAAWRDLFTYLDANASLFTGYTASTWTSGCSTVKDPYIFAGDGSIAL